MSAALEIGKWFMKKSMVKVSDYLDPNCIVFLDADDRDEALSQLVDVLYQNNKITDKESFYKAILEREKIVSTGIGMSVAIPHAKLKGFDDFFIAIGMQKEKALEWNSLDKAPVRLIFMIGGPEDQQTEYLNILSKLTHLIKDETLRKKIFLLDSSNQIFKHLEKF